MILKNIKFKNFFSVGNSFIEIDLLKHKRTVISGKNGNGKSTIANAITFLLFGNTIKKINKPQIVNSINGKNCLLEGNLTSEGHDYLIRRGIKPNIFEVFKDGVLVDQTSVGDYQTYLEEKVLKCSYRTFVQTSIISVENYTPFMSLPKDGRRKFIEDILDIGVFSTMNVLTTTKSKKNKEEKKTLDALVVTIKDRIILQRSHIELLEAKKKIGIESLDIKIIEYQNEIDEVSKIFETSDDITIAFNSKRIDIKADIALGVKIKNEIAILNSKIAASQKDIDFFESHDNCLTCRQSITEDHIRSIVGQQKTDNETRTIEVKVLKQDLEEYALCDTELLKLSTQESKHNGQVIVANTTITRTNKLISEVVKEKAAMMEDDDISGQKESISKDAKIAMGYRERQLALVEEQGYLNVMLELFKDSGIKSKIVDQYVPIINDMVNEYLEKLDFFVSFNLDSEFNESIKSRHRDDFTYNSFSAGEKQRVDLALLFTFQRLAKRRNSFSSNILLMDEILDASIDSDGIDLLMEIFDEPEFTDKNLFVISHRNKEVFEETFDGLYEVYKRDNFTCLK